MPITENELADAHAGVSTAPLKDKLVLCPECGWLHNYAAAHIPEQYIIPHSLPPEIRPFDVAYLDSPFPLDVALNYADNFRREAKDGMGLLFWGKNGTGKSFLACHVGLRLLRRGVKVRFVTFANALQETYRWFAAQKRGEALNDPMTKYERCDLLILDELGQSRPTDFAGDRLFSLVNERMNKKLPTIYTTNADPDLLGERLAPGDRITAKALTDRITGMTYDVEFVAAESLRQAKKRDKFARLMGEEVDGRHGR